MLPDVRSPAIPVTSGLQRLFSGLVFFVMIVMLANFRAREFGSDSVDFQVAAKLGCYAAILAICLFYYRLWVRPLARIDNVLLLPFLALITVSCFWAPSALYSLGAVFTVLSVLTLFYAASQILSHRQLMLSLLTALTLCSILSLILYFVAPDMARAKVWVGNTLVTTKRLSGISGPNGAGLLTAISLMIAFYNRADPSSRIRLLIRTSAVINFLVLLLSNSRTSLLALVVSFLAVFFMRFSHYRFAVLFGFLGLAILAALTLDFTPLLELVSRSGDAQEILSGTGRSHIWAEVVKLIHIHPMRGWGYASSSFIIPSYADEIGHIPPHAHNTFLQVLFSVGYPGLLLYIGIFAIKLFYIVRMNDMFKLALITFILVHGITEPSIFQSIAGVSTVAFALLMGLNYRSDIEAANDRAMVRRDWAEVPG